MTRALVERLTSASAELRHAYVNLKSGAVRDAHQFADGLIAPQIVKLEEVVVALSQERACSTCRHGRVRPKDGFDPIVCFAEWPERPGRAAPTFDRRVTADYSCCFWGEQADPKESA
jgi:hypothetical protein